VKTAIVAAAADSTCMYGARVSTKIYSLICNLTVHLATVARIDSDRFCGGASRICLMNEFSMLAAILALLPVCLLLDN
jgi:hypothetical protein